MSGLSYEAVARFAQQGGTVYFGVLFFIEAHQLLGPGRHVGALHRPVAAIAGALFFIVVIYALWPRHTETFKRLAALPLEDCEDDHVPS